MSDELTRYLEATSKALESQQAQISVLMAAVAALASTHDDPEGFEEAFDGYLASVMKRSRTDDDKDTIASVARMIRGSISD